MINYDLPITVTIDNTEYPINRKGDYRMVLDVISVLNDDSLNKKEKAYTAMCIFYDFNIPQNAQKAMDEIINFINCGDSEDEEQKEPPIMDWEQDFSLLISPINRTLGQEIRAMRYLHWWTFISAYMEIGDCMFKTVVDIRRKKRKNKKLDTGEREFYAKNKRKVDLKVKFDDEEKEFFKQLIGE